MKRIYIFCVLVVLLTCGCTYSFFVNAYPHLKTVNVVPFENMTSEYSLALDFQNYLVGKFQSDGKLKISTMTPDSQIEGVVKDYRNEILSYDFGGSVSEYRVSILFSITMTDMVMSDIIFNNQAMLVTEVYAPESTIPDQCTTEEQAIESIFEKVYENIINNTLKNW